MDFKNNEDLRNFVKKLIVDLENNNEIELVTNLRNWNDECFTSSSEFLGELMLILERVELSTKLSDVTKKQVAECLLIIRNSFTV